VREFLFKKLMSFKSPALWIVSGCSQSGKTEFSCRVIRHADKLFDHHFDHIIWCYQEEAAVPRDRLPSSVTLFKGLPESFSNFPENSLIVIDDAQAEAAGSRAVLDLFTRGSHHKFQNCILNCQNIFF